MAGLISAVSSTSSAMTGGVVLNESEWSSSCESCLLQEEYDSVQREARIYLYTRPLEGILGTKEETKFHHWAVVFHFMAGDRWITYEAFDKDGVLTPGCINERPRIEGKYLMLGSAETSPRALKESAQKCKVNNKPYTAASNNCQHWVKQFIKVVASAVSQKLNEIKTLKESNPFIGQALTFSSAASNPSCNAVSSILGSSKAN